MKIHSIILSISIIILPLLVFFINFKKVDSFGVAELSSFFSYYYEDQLMYYDPISGSIIEYNLKQNNTINTYNIFLSEEEAFQILTNESISQEWQGEDIIQNIIFARNNKKALLYTKNILLPQINQTYPFYNPNTSEENLWWIYDFNTNDAIPLSPRFTSVGWYSDNQIIYVFDNTEIAVAPIDTLGDFRVLSQDIPAPVDPLRPIIANSERQLIPLETGYLIGNRGEFRFYPSSGQAQALTSHEKFLVHSSTQIDILDWKGNRVERLVNLKPLMKAQMVSNDTLLILFEDGTVVKYSLNGVTEVLSISEGFIDDMFYADANDPSLSLIVQQGEVFVYDSSTNQIENTIFGDSEALESQRLERQSKNTNSPLVIIGGMIVLIASFGYGLMMWKRRKK